MLSIEHNFLFVHIPKTAGNSIQSILSKYSEDEIIVSHEQDGIHRFDLHTPKYNFNKHSRLIVYKRRLEKDLYRKLFKFTIVRNPWDRMISFYFSPHRGLTEWNRSKFIDFVKERETIKSFLSTGFFNNIGNRPFKNLDFILRFEHLQEDFNLLCEKLNIKKSKLPHVNNSQHNHYSKYYDEELVNLVAGRFRHEIDYFGYTFSEE